MIVHKFGGTSVGSAQRFANTADIVIAQAGRSGPAPGGTVVVVSAMSGVTDQLIAGARAAAEGRDSLYREIKAGLLSRHLEVVETLLAGSPERFDVSGLIEDQLHDLERLYRSIAVLGELTVRGCDAVASLGERLSSSILAAVLRERGLRAQALSSTQLIVSDDNFGQAAPLMGPTRRRLQERVRPLVDQGSVPVITGYVAATGQGVTTTLGRGGGDYAAAIVAAGLDADEVWIWSDVDGILTADPNLVPQARTLSELSYAEAANLAYYGADVLHPKTIRPVIAGGIPLRILNSFNPSHPGTRIVRTPGTGRRALPAIISASGLCRIVVGSQDDSWTLQQTTRALQRLSEAGVDVPMFSQSFAEHNLNLVVRRRDQAHCLQLLRREFELEDLDERDERDSPDAGQAGPGDGCSLGVMEQREQVATISVVGVPGWNELGTVAHTFAALGKCGTRVIAVAQAASEHSISFCIPEEQLADTVRLLHRELGLEDGDG